MAILHGGQLSRVAKQYQIPEKEWLDLSTGIAPFSYPIPDIPLSVWQDLPTISASLIDVAKNYYQAKYCWPLSGSQSLIEKLPQLWSEKQPLASHVYLPKVGYKEHQQAWKTAGYQLHFYQQTLPANIEQNSVVVVINPNNPLTDIFTIKQLSALQKQCHAQNSLLIIDEAFTDVFAPEYSFVAHIKAETTNVIVLRSFGKFFGLAGLRIGFACCSAEWFELIKHSTSPWAVNGPALYITELALNDKKWQTAQKQRLQKQSQKQQQLINSTLPILSIKSNALFITAFFNNAPAIYQQLCQHAVYVRLTDENDALRFGIADEVQLKRLAIVLMQCAKKPL
ncbi:aminotransferase class I/II-fold pyridoxal phosphate-dependent enzyme [Psychromonas hadalis]|uniref:aminotransferase class I/II-fold pyridoxal phosphate-dependent enzyme n=1 Tax=Psychromonas hadalis TaxID=211669 RepID=UPI0003B510FC|nr:aminotransferase class I/II-fold pyridoxal phosphate-dependent enzyme [Psychromonas hadalis]